MARVLIIGDAQTAQLAQDALFKARPAYYSSLYDLTFDGATTTSAAIDLMRTRNYELVIMDMLSAREDNAEFIRILREKSTRSVLPVIVISAVDGVDLRYDTIRAGASDYFTIPFSTTEHERFLRVAFNLILER